MRHESPWTMVEVLETFVVVADAAESPGCRRRVGGSLRS